MHVVWTLVRLTAWILSKRSHTTELVTHLPLHPLLHVDWHVFNDSGKSVGRRCDGSGKGIGIRCMRHRLRRSTHVECHKGGARIAEPGPSRNSHLCVILHDCLQWQVIAFYNEAESIYMRRGILPLLIEVQMKTIRMLLAFKGKDAKLRVNSTVTRVLEVWPRLKSEFDRMNLVIEVSNVDHICLSMPLSSFLVDSQGTGSETQESLPHLAGIGFRPSHADIRCGTDFAGS